MTGVTLSRWSMSYFVAALCALIVAEGLMAVGYGYPAAPLQAPETLLVVHLLAIGWLSLLMCGALFQFVPVLVARPLYSDQLPLPALLLLLVGLGCLLATFLQLAGTINVSHPLIPYAATALGAGFALAIYNLGRTLAAARPLPLPARFVVVALVSLAVTVVLGSIFGFVLTTPVQSEALFAITVSGLPLHVIAGVGGWLTFTALGVSYRLMAMFMLAPELDGTGPRAVFWYGTAALCTAVFGGLALILVRTSMFPALALSGVMAFAALGPYGANMLHLYRARKRRVIELNSQMAALAFTSLAATVVLSIVLALLGRFTDHVAAVVFLAVFGWLTGLGLAKLYKITAFLTWLECYGPVLGKVKTPRVQDLVVEPKARKWFYLYFLSAWSGTASLALNLSFAFHLSAAGMLLGTTLIAFYLIRTRRLVEVPDDLRLPEGVHAPSLFSCAGKST